MVMVAGKPMKLRVVPADDNGELEKGDKNHELEKGDKNGEHEKGDKNVEREKGDNYASETSDSDIKLKPDLVVEETESEKEDLAGYSKNELVEKGLKRIEIMNMSTQEEEVSVSDTSVDHSEDKSKELLNVQEELLSDGNGITSEEEEKKSHTDEGFETDANKHDDSAGSPSKSDKETDLNTDDISFEGVTAKTLHNETIDMLTSIASSREEGQFDSAEISAMGGFCNYLYNSIAGRNMLKNY